MPPDEYHVRFTDTGLGRMRSRELAGDGPRVVAVQGMAVSEYQLPGLAALGLPAHLLDLPGLSGSGPANARPDVRRYAGAVAGWLDRAALGPVVLIGHSSGTQVVAHVAADRPDLVGAVVLASPTVDPAVRSWPRLVSAWRRDGRYPTPGLMNLHLPEWVRAGLPQLRDLVSAHLRDRLDDTVPRIRQPLLVLRAEQDRVSTPEWPRRLASRAPDGRFVAMPGPHTFVWTHPDAWCAPVRELAVRSPGAGPARLV